MGSSYSGGYASSVVSPGDIDDEYPESDDSVKPPCCCCCCGSSAVDDDDDVEIENSDSSFSDPGNGDVTGEPPLLF